PRLRLEVDEHFRHKDVYQHSLTVLEQAIALEARYGLEADLRLRLAALLHDIGKPKTRRLLPDGRVAFHHHEVVGASMARARLSRSGWSRCARIWTATRSWRSSACGRARWSARRTGTCWSCAWSRGRWGPSGPFRSCGAGRRPGDCRPAAPGPLAGRPAGRTR